MGSKKHVTLHVNPFRQHKAFSARVCVRRDPPTWSNCVPTGSATGYWTGLVHSREVCLFNTEISEHLSDIFQRQVLASGSLHLVSHLEFFCEFHGIFEIEMPVHGLTHLLPGFQKPLLGFVLKKTTKAKKICDSQEKILPCRRDFQWDPHGLPPLRPTSCRMNDLTIR